MKRIFLIFMVLGTVLSFAQAQVQLEQQVFKIAGELRCPICRSESASDSSSASSTEFRNIIRERLQQGQSETQILGFFQGKYGDWILMDPPRRGLYLWVWGLPLVAGVLGLGTFGYFVARWRKNAALPQELSPQERERVQRELGRL